MTDLSLLILLIFFPVVAHLCPSIYRSMDSILITPTNPTIEHNKDEETFMDQIWFRASLLEDSPDTSCKRNEM